MLALTELGVEVFNKRYSKRNQESFWNNYDLLVWEKNDNGYSDIKGSFRNDSWGIMNKFSIDSRGVWVLPSKYVKYFK